ncbi:DNA polymerase alpha accessory factor Mcl1 [Vermiconidia calcicola]|uniref:DNA polymerase alpha accessory factor Mcl1 n=1 Tax=Vermiconidia calcicola TaxID=1690605 RepID=A0ACC3NNR2_9PEZI|nr:DNA polymerase alpha accessory factor Mcl1 [Vermiconidia calcicola]
MANRLRARPAHAPGPAYLSYTPNGKKLVTVGLNGALRVFQHDSEDEPAVIDVLTDNHFAVAATIEFILVGAEDGSVTKYSLLTNSMEEMLVRSSLPVRDIAISPDGQWAAVASDELEVKVVNTQDMTRVMYLREHPRPAKHVSFDISGAMVAVSCTDGLVYVYSLSSEQPQLVKRIDGLIKMLDNEAEASSKAVWHPDGRAFAAPSSTRDFQVVARNDWKLQKAFRGGHRGDISAAAWSPNGALLVTAGVDKSLVLWETRSQKMLKSFDDVHNVILAMQWHPTDNVLSYTNNNGELFIRENFAPNEHAKLLKIALQHAPMNGDPLNDISGNARKPMLNGVKPNGHVRSGDDYIEGLLDDAMSQDGADFIEDDDGAGYAEEPNRNGKRVARSIEGPQAKRQAPGPVWQPQIHEPFQPGSTPWKGNRRYLCLNLTGFVWTVNQETHNTVTVEFYDRQEHRDFHFTDPYMYDKACLNEKGTLFACPASSHHPAILYYRPHETWTSRTDWRTELPKGEEVSSISLSDSCIVATTTAGYVRIYSLFGVPLKMYRQKSSPAVTCVSWRDYVMTVGNGPVGGDETTRLLYTIENVKRDEICQSEDILALPDGVELKSVFFSEKGDPCIYDSDGVLLILQHWRTPGQAKWVPLLDTRTLDRLASGKKEESYWPVAVANNKFHCIILKGGEEYPYFPRPLLSDFEFRIPISSAPNGDEDEINADNTLQNSLEEKYVQSSLQYSLIQDLVENTNATQTQKLEATGLEREVDKVLLQLLAVECREGEERGMKALEIATLMKDRTGKMLEAAGKVAQRFQRDILSEKITQLAERRLVGLVDDDEV